MDKYQAAYAKRLSKLKSDNNSPKAIARQRYEQSNVKNDISFKAFKRAFYNESIEIYNLTDGAAIQKVFTPLIMLATAWIVFVCSVSN
ncbi:hypothetical protein V3H44_02410 [Vibrio parahaemolyticus]|uniref:hypothetical protein n=1 Tax=Vibrio parahaemolyticus TaxID=670 RepID=UPI003B66F1B5